MTHSGKMKKHQLIQIIRDEVQRALLTEDSKILIPRRMEGRLDKRIQDYIKNGCKGDLDFEGASITKLPANLKKVGETLWLTGTNITKLPDDLEVGFSLWINHTPITELPRGLKVRNNLIVKGTPLAKKYSIDQIRKIIEDLGGTVGGDIYA